MEAHYPRRISPCPIVETTIDIKCNMLVPKEAVVGIIYKPIQELYQNKIQIQATPIASLPEAVREQDPKLREQPTMQILCPEGRILLGKNRISFSLFMPYESWEKSKMFVEKIIKVITDSKIISDIISVSIRYLDFFKDINVFDKTNLRFKWDGKEGLCARPTAFRTEISNKEYFVHSLQITNFVHLENVGLRINANGSLIDLTTICTSVETDNVLERIDECHTESKIFFFDLLNDDFISTLSPEY